MIAKPPGWRLIPGIEAQTLIPPEGGDSRGIRYVEKRRPLLRLGDLIADWLRRHPTLSHTAIGEPERLLTAEGEHGAVLSVDGALDGNAVQATIGVVFADDYYSLIEGFALEKDGFAAMRATVRGLVLSDRHLLGRRRRRYEYVAPDRWQPIVRGFTTDWISPGFPLEWGLIVAFAATPIDPSLVVDGDALVARAIERGFVLDTAAPPIEVANDHGLRGVVTEMIGRQGEARMLRSFVTLTDDDYLYPAELMARTEESWPSHREAFNRLWGSIRAIPRFAAPRTSAEVFDLWAE